MSRAVRHGALAVVLSALLLAAPPVRADGGNSPQVNYMLHCMGCHGANGQGSDRAGVPRFTNFVGYYTRVPGGRQFLLEVPGASQAPLNDAELAEVLNWVLRTQSGAQLGDDFAPYTEAEVTASRGKPIDVMAVRAELLAQIKAEFGASPDGGYD